VGGGEVEEGGEGGLVLAGGIASRLNPSAQFLFGTSHRFGIRMRDRIGSNSTSAAKRFQGPEKPRLILGVGHYHLARSSPRFFIRPGLKTRRDPKRAVILVAIEQDKNAVATLI
jgi:hypothetical protein